MSFVHLNVHSEYSLIDGIARIGMLPKEAREKQIPALALTDRNNVFGAIKFWRAARKEGIKPIIGAELSLVDNDNMEHVARILLFCQHMEGYHNLSSLMTDAYTQQKQGMVCVTMQSLAKYHQGLIAVNTMECSHLPLDKPISDPLIEKRIHFWKKYFPDRFYLELCRTGHPDQEYYLHRCLSLANHHTIPVVASNMVRFLRPEDYEAHEARVCISQGYTLDDQRRPRNYTEQQYLRSATEMQELFADIPSAIENTIQLACRCNLEFEFTETALPHFPIEDGKDEDTALAELAVKQLSQYLAELELSTEQQKVYQDRLQRELEVIQTTGYAGYFLIVQDFIQWARGQGITIGPGRGSGAGSLVAWVLGITEIDPIRFGLLFERFLNPERISLPDFDIDFCMLRRDDVIAYVTQKYGEDKVARIVTFGSMSARAVIRDIGRVLGMPYPQVDYIAKLVPNKLDITLHEALEEKVLQAEYKKDENIQTLIELAKKLENLPRNVATHAGGLVIAPKELTKYVPLYCEESASITATQFDKDDVEEIGLVKFDFLGLRTLTVIDVAVNDINKLRLQDDKAAIDISKIALDDIKTYEKILCTAKTSGVFQLESQGMRNYLKELHTDSFDDLVAMIALYRPGPMNSGMLQDFIERKNNRQEVSYLHEMLRPVLKDTRGVIIYQEQVMEIARVLADYTLGGADILRRAMGKKKPEEMEKQQQVFIDGAAKKGVRQDLAEELFKQIAAFAGYGFNKSHSVAYAVIAFRTAWLKAHYPAHFMAAAMTADMNNNIEKVIAFIRECQTMDIKILPPSINHSKYRFFVEKANCIRYGLGAIKGIGEGVIACIVEERENAGNFTSLGEFCQRIDLLKVSQRIIRRLIKSGAMDDFSGSRAGMVSDLPRHICFAEQCAKNARDSQDDLFGLQQDETITNIQNEVIKNPASAVEEWTELEELDHEYTVLEIYLSKHPLDFYPLECAQASHNSLQLKEREEVFFLGLIMKQSYFQNRNAKKIEMLLSDPHGEVLAIVAEDLVQNSQHTLKTKDMLFVKGKVSNSKFHQRYVIEVSSLYNIIDFRGKHACLCLSAKVGQLTSDLQHNLEKLLHTYRGGNCMIKLKYHHDNSHVTVHFGDNWRVHASNELIDGLKNLLGYDQVNLQYHKDLV